MEQRQMQLIVLRNGARMSGRRSRDKLSQKGIEQMRARAKQIAEQLSELKGGSVVIMTAQSPQAIESGEIFAEELGLQLSNHGVGAETFQKIGYGGGKLIADHLQDNSTAVLVVIAHYSYVISASSRYTGEKIRKPHTSRGFQTFLEKTGEPNYTRSRERVENLAF